MLLIFLALSFVTGRLESIRLVNMSGDRAFVCCRLLQAHCPDLLLCGQEGVSIDKMQHKRFQKCRRRNAAPQDIILILGQHNTAIQ